MLYVIEFIVAFIGGFVTGLFVNLKKWYQGLVSGSMILPKGRYSYATTDGYEKLGGFRSRFMGFFGLLFSLLYIAFVLLLIYDSILLKPFAKNLTDVSFYFKIIAYIFGWYCINKMKTGKTVREQLNIKDSDIKQ